jgi:hypothetical protein
MTNELCVYIHTYIQWTFILLGLSPLVNCTDQATKLVLRVIRATDPHGRILGFLARSRYYFFEVAPHEAFFFNSFISNQNDSDSIS